MRRSARQGLVLLVLAFATGFALPSAEDEFVPLFDGKTTEGWEPVGGQPGNWSVKDGLLVTKGEGGGWLATSKTYDNFVLKLEYRTGPAGNSGVFIRSPRTGDPAYTGMEIQVLDDDAEVYKTLKPFQYTGSVYGVIAAERGHTKPAGQWNAMEIRADGPKITIKLNGATVVDGDLSRHEDAAKEHPGIKRDTGHIGLQSHNDPVEFRKIEVRVLKK